VERPRWTSWIEAGSRALGAHSLRLNWDSSALRVDSVVGGTTPEFSAAPTQNINNAAGFANMAAAQSVRLDGPTGEVHVAGPRVTLLGGSGATTTVTLSVDSLFDTDGRPIAECPPADGASCTIEISPGLCGDVNDDRDVNIGDALAVAQFDVGLRQCFESPFVRPEVCDVNPQPPMGQPDGDCNIGDALKMAQCDVGLMSCEFACEPFSCGGPAGAGAQDAPGGRGAAAATIGLVPTPENPLQGTTFTGEITIDVGETPLGAYSIDLNCDTAALVIASVRGGAAPEFAAAPTANIEGCRVSLALSANEGETVG
jgi:hypothetical protein